MTENAATTINEPGPTTWTALRYPVFRGFWICSFAAFIGSSMHSVGAGWLMTRLDPSPLMVSLVQATFTLSVFLVSLPSGVVADLVNRKWIMIGALCVLMAATGVTGVLTLAGGISPAGLLALTFAFGFGAAAMTPAMQATTLDLVSRDDLPSALTLNSMAVSGARSIGPALAGLLLLAWGAGWMFCLNVLAFVGLTLVILAWRNTPPARDRPRPSFRAAYREGLHFATRNQSMRALLSKSVIVFLPISILLALLPLVVVENLGGSPGAFGVLLGFFGFGSVIASLLLQRLYRKFSRLRVINMAAVVHALGVLLVANSGNLAVSIVGMLLTGLAWTALMTSVNIIAQLLLPSDMRGRGLSINNMTIMGVLAAGSAAWGQVAEWAGITQTLVIASMLGLASPFLTRHMRPTESESPPES